MTSKRVLDIMICPVCRGELLMDGDNMVCGQGHQFSVVDGISRFVDSDRYVDTFSFEWDAHRMTQLDSATGLTRAEDMFFARTGLQASELQGKLVLDAGCGIGRFCEIVVKHGGHAVGVDLSYSVNNAKKNVPKADIVQADILNLPFANESFDIVVSLGVIHHTEDTYRAFAKLAGLVKPGGKLAVWVYSNDGWKSKVYNKIAGFYRVFTTRMPKRILYRLSYVSVPLYYLHRTPVIGRVSRILLPTSCEPDPQWRVLDTYDWYSPKYQSKHTYDEVEVWFGELGFTDTTRLSHPVAMCGTKAKDRI